jgi:asparagine synthase (glutamine-hydrolysing)
LLGRIDADLDSMCGILGIISDDLSVSQRRLDDSQVIAMRETMTSRGPDGSGMFREGPITLAHRRLAIRDIDLGQQPMISQNGRFALVFNGEIYNDDQIRDDLADRGVLLKSRCDTEALIEAWAIWGPSCLDKLRGMFAFGIADRRSGHVWIVRDRCGVKPLFYTQVDGEFVFASSIAAIRKHPRFSSRPNFAAIGHYLQTLRTTMDRETVFEGIFSVRPAEMIRLAGSNRIHQTYWSLPVADVHPLLTESCESISYENAVMQTERAIEESVKLRLKSDVAVGVMLSGGVDSSTLATFTRQQLGDSIVGCCGGGTEPGNDETGGDFQFAKECADELGFEFSEIRVPDDDYFETCQSLIDHYETPISTPTDAIIYRVARQLKRSVGVAIGGEGADEVFCGYTIPHWSGNDFDRARSLTRIANASSGEIGASLMRQYGRTVFDSHADHYLSTCGLIPKNAQQILFQPEHWKQVLADGASEKYYEKLFTSQPGLPMSQRYARVLFRNNLESLLGRLDSATMAASLEARVPFTDHLLVEQAFRYPHHFKIDVCPNETKPWLSSMELAQRGSLRSKRILRSVASRIMPKRLACRPKMSFPTPVPIWLDQKWKPWFDNKLEHSSFAKEIFQPESLRQLNQLPSSLSMWKWPVLNTILWGERCFG